MQNTPPELPVAERPDKDLIEDLCLALRDVGVRTYSLPNDERAVSAVTSVQEIYRLLQRRKVNVRERLERLSEETRWQMGTLLEDCLSFPEVVPWVRNLDGIRNALRCTICRKLERPDREGIWLCDECLEQASQSIETHVPMKGLLLLKLYNEEYRCKHATDETLLVAFDDYEPLNDSYCIECISEEQTRRRQLS